MSIQHVGGLSRKDVPSESGTFSQAWSLSEYIRSILEGYMGFRFLVNQGFEIKPALPEDLQYAHFQSYFHGLVLKADYEKQPKGGLIYKLDFSNRLNISQTILFQDKWLQKPVILEVSPGLDHYRIETAKNKLTILRNGEPYIAESQDTSWPNLFNARQADTFHFVNTRNIHPSEMHFKSQLH